LIVQSIKFGYLDCGGQCASQHAASINKDCGCPRKFQEGKKDLKWKPNLIQFFHQVPIAERDKLEKELKRSIDEMLDVMYGPTRVHMETIASVNTAFSHINEVGRNIRRDNQHRQSTQMVGNGNTQDSTMYLD